MTDLQILESPIQMIEGETITYSINWLGATSVSSPAATVYKNGNDYSSTAMPSGSHSASGNVQTLKPIVAQGGDGGQEYVVVIEADVDGNIERRKLIVEIVKDEVKG